MTIFSNTLPILRFSFLNLPCTKVDWINNYATLSETNSRFSGVKTYLNLDNQKAILVIIKVNLGFIVLLMCLMEERMLVVGWIYRVDLEITFRPGG